MAKPATPKEIFATHEIDMLWGTFHRLQTVSDPVMRNALMESFCIHARNLDDFFLGRRGAKAETYATANYRAYLAGRWDVGTVRQHDLFRAAVPA